MLLESALPRYSNVFAQRKSLAQKIGLQLVTCFCNLETFLNLEFETGKEPSEKSQNDGYDFAGSSSDEDEGPFRVTEKKDRGEDDGDFNYRFEDPALNDD